MEDQVQILPYKRPRLSPNWSQCIICQSTKKLERFTQPGQKGVARLIDAAQERKDTVFLRIKPNIENLTAMSVKWHPSCYSMYTSCTNIHHLVKSETTKPVSNVVPQTRQHTNHASAFSVEKCVICQKTRCCLGPKSDRMSSYKSRQLMQVSSPDGEEALLGAARIRQDDISLRLAGKSLITQGVKYHKACRDQYVLSASRKRKLEMTPEQVRDNAWDDSFNKLIEEIDEPLMTNGVGLELSGLCEKMNQQLLLAGTSECDNRQMKNLLTRHYGDKISFHQQQSPTISQRVCSSAVNLDDAIQRITEISQGVVLSKEEPDVTTLFTPSDNAEKETHDMDPTLTRAVYHMAKKIKADIEKIQTNSCEDPILQVDQDHAAKMVPDSLYLFLRLILTEDEDSRDMPVRHQNDEVDRMILAIGQDVVYQASNKRVTPAKHVGLAMAVHQATRSKRLIQLLHAAGHCIGYDTLRRIDTSMAAEQVARCQENNNVPVPPNLLHGRFVQFSGDNVDIIEETLDGKGTFHATQMVAFQPGPSLSPAPAPLPAAVRQRSLGTVPPELNQIVPAGMTAKRPGAAFPRIDGDVCPTDVPGAFYPADLPWLLSRNAAKDQQVIPAWTGYNQTISTVKYPETIIGYMPIIRQPAHEYDTLWTVIRRAQQVSQHLGQTHTVITFDQALYCKAKELTWLRPNETKDVIIRLGGFHIGLNFLRCIGQHFEDSGLKDVLVESGVFSDCTAKKIMEARCWNRAVRAHKLTYEALWRCLWPVFREWCMENGGIPGDELSTQLEVIAEAFSMKDASTARSTAEAVESQGPAIEDLIDAFESSNSNKPVTAYWLQYLKMVSTLLRFIRAERCGNWDLHLSSFASMLPWFIIYDHTNYARWGPVYLVDMVHLRELAPEVYSQFRDGHFGVKETGNKFNVVPTDQALEHVNRLGKIAGGLVGITRNDPAMDRWSLNFHNRTALTNQTFRMLGVNLDANHDPKESNPSRLARDEADVQKIMAQMQHYKVFTNESSDLTSISTNDVAPSEVTDDLMSAFARGNQLLQQFMEERMVPGSQKGFFDTLKKQKSKTFATLYKVRSLSVDGRKTIKADRDLYRRLLTAAQAGRPIDLTSLLGHELSPVPLSLAKTDGSLHLSDKANLLPILEKDQSVPVLPVSTGRSCCIIDAMALVRAIGKPKDATTFGDLAEVINRCVLSHFGSCTRVDVVFDTYRPGSTKLGTRGKRAMGTRAIRRMIDGPTVPLPVQWDNFINMTDNKANLTEFLTTSLKTCAATLGDHQELVVAGGTGNGQLVWTSSTTRTVQHLESTQEEADTRIVLHAADAAETGYHRIIVECQDTDVVVLLLHFADSLTPEVWMHSGTGNRRRYIPIHKISQMQPDVVRQALLGFHAMTGCDTTSKFHGFGKRLTWKAFIADPTTLHHLGENPFNDALMAAAEAFVVRVYDPHSKLTSVDELRAQLFHTKAPEKLPPTRDALELHTKRAHFQAMVWRNSLVAKPSLPPPMQHGWEEVDGKLQPALMTKPAVPSKCLQLISCGCKTQCSTTNCACRKHKLPCTGSCKCEHTSCHNPATHATTTDDDDEDDEDDE